VFARARARSHPRRILGAFVSAVVWLAFCAATLVVLDAVSLARTEDASLHQAQADLKQSLSLARDGLGSDAGSLVEAEVMAAHARSEVAAAQQRLDRDPLLAVVRRVPAARRQLVGTEALNSLVVRVADIAVRGEAMGADLQTARHATGKPSTLDVVGRFYVDRQAAIERLAADVFALPDSVAAVDRRDLAAPLLQAFEGLDRPMKLITEQREPVQRALRLAPAALGAKRPARYLLLFADNTELRPGGGFIGTFAVMGFDHGAYQKPEVTRVGVVEEPEARLRAYLVGGIHYVRPPIWLINGFPDHARETMTLGNSAATPNWPDNARLARALYASETGNQVDGVVQLDLTAISYIVRLTGPITLNRANHSPMVVTADNASDLLVAETRSTDKSILSVFEQELLLRLETMSPDRLGKVFTAIQRAAAERHLMVSLDDPTLQAEVDRNGLARPIPAPGNDAAMMVFANAAANKTDHHIQRSLRITVRPHGQHHAEVTITNNNIGPERISRFLEFVRLYVPSNARLTRISGFLQPGNNYIPSSPLGDLGTENGWRMFGGWLQVQAGRQFTVSWDYVTPPLGRDYQLTVVKQPGIDDYSVDVSLEAPGYRSPTAGSDPTGPTWRFNQSRDETLSATRP